MTRHTLTLGVLALALFASGEVFANQCFGADGAFGFQDRFAIDEIVYISGDFDLVTEHLVCGDGDIYIVRHGDPGMNDVTRGGANYATGCSLGGAFFDAPVWLPDLTPGVYDCVIDDNLNGVFDPGIDYRGERAIVVQNVRTGVMIDVAAFKASASILQMQWENLGQAWGALQHLYNALGCLGFPGGGVGFITCFIAADQFCVPFSYNDAVFTIGSKIITGVAAAEAHKYMDIVADPPDPNYQVFATPSLASTLADLAAEDVDEVHPFVPLLNADRELANREIANHGVAQAALLEAILPTLERIQGAEAGGVGGEDNLWVYLQAVHLRELARALGASADAARTHVTAWKTDLDAGGVETPAFPTQTLTALKEQLRDGDFDDAQRAALEEAGFDEAAIEDLRQRILSVPDVPPGTTLRTGLDALDATLVQTRTFADELIAQANRLAQAQQPYANHTMPVVTAGGPYSATVGAPLSLAAQADRAGAVAWDLDLDGEFDDASGLEAQFTPTRAGGRLIAVRAEGGASIGLAWVDVARANRPPTILSFEPSGEMESTADPTQPLGFSATWEDPDGDETTGTWTVDGEEAGTGQSFEFTPADALTGPVLVELIVSDGQSEARQWRAVFPAAQTPGDDVGAEDAGSDTEAGSDDADPTADAERTDAADDAEPEADVAADVPPGDVAPDADDGPQTVGTTENCACSTRPHALTMRWWLRR